MNKPIKILCGVTVRFGNEMFFAMLEKYGPSGWNAWIDAINKQNLVYPSYDIRFNGPVFQIEFILTDIDLSNRELDNIDLTQVYIAKGYFRESSLYKSKILIAKNCDFIGADLRASFFNSADISGSIFIDAMIDNVNWERAFFYNGMKPIGLPENVMARLQQLEPDDAEMSETKQIPCLAEIQDASYWVHQGD